MVKLYQTAIALFMVCLLTGVVSATDYYSDDYPVTVTPEYSYVITHTLPVVGTTYSDYSSPEVIDKLQFKDITKYRDLKYVAYFSEYWTTTFIDDDSIKSGSTSFTVSGGSGISGSGTIDYFVNTNAIGTPTSIRIGMEFDSWTIGTSTGSQTCTVSYTPANINQLKLEPVSGYKSGKNDVYQITTDENDVAFASTNLGYPCLLTGDYYAYGRGDWVQDCTISKGADTLTFDYDRDGSASTVYIYDSDSVVFHNNYETEDIDLVVYTINYPVTLEVTDPYSHEYTYTFYSAAAGEISGDLYTVSYDNPVYAYDDIDLHITPVDDAPDVDDLDFISVQVWNENDASPSGVYYENQAGTWYAWNDDTEDYDIEITDPYNPPTADLFTEAGEGELKLEIFTADGRIFLYEDTITVLDSSDYATLHILVLDGSTNHFLQYPDICVYNHDTDTWSNQTPEYGNDIEVKLNKDDVYNVLIEKTGYTDYEITNLHPWSDLTYRVYLYPIAAPDDPGNVYITFSVYNAVSSDMLDAALVTCNGETIETDDGIAVFEVPKNDTYTYSVTKGGYEGKDGSATVTTEGVTKYIAMTPQATPTPTPTWTATPTPTGGTPVEKVKWGWDRVFQQLGGDPDYQGYIQAFIVMLFSAAVVGRATRSDSDSIASFAGGAVGAGVGFVFSVALGWIPFYIVVLILAIFAIIAAWGLFGNKGGA